MKLSVPELAKKAEISLGELINILSIEHTYETAANLTREFILTSTSDDILKKGLEFFYMHGLVEDLRMLIDRNRRSSCVSARNWAAFYQLLLDRNFNSYNPQIFLDKLTHLNTEEDELTSLVEFAQADAYFDMNNFEKAAEILMSQKTAYWKTNDVFLLTSFNTRLYCKLFMYYWIRNELIIARKYAYKALNKQISPSIRTSMNAYLGLSYLFDTYSQGMYHLSEALKIAEAHEIKNLIYLIKQRYIPFLCAHFNETEGIKTDLIYEQAHLEIAKGSYHKAIELLSNYPMDDPFVQYYMGVAAGDKQMLTRSYNHFVEKESNYFFSRLPLKAMQQLSGNGNLATSY